MALVVWYGWYGLVHLGDLGVKWHGGTTAGCPKKSTDSGRCPVLWSVSKLETNFSEQKIHSQNSAGIISLSGHGGNQCTQTCWKMIPAKASSSGKPCGRLQWKVIRARQASGYKNPYGPSCFWNTWGSIGARFKP